MVTRRPSYNQLQLTFRAGRLGGGHMGYRKGYIRLFLIVLVEPTVNGGRCSFFDLVSG